MLEIENMNSYTAEDTIQAYDPPHIADGSIACNEPGCEFRANRAKQLRHHLSYRHKMKIRVKTYYFNNMNEVNRWLQEYELTSNVKYYLLSSKLACKHTYYYCSDGRKKIQLNGTSKVTNACISNIVVKQNPKSKQISVEHVIEHYGHPVVSEALPTKTKLITKEDRIILESLVDRQFTRSTVTTHFPNGAGFSDEKFDALRKEHHRMKFYKFYKRIDSDYKFNSPYEHWINLLGEINEDDIVVHKRAGDQVGCIEEMIRGGHGKLALELAREYNENNIYLPIQNQFLLARVTSNQIDLLVEFDKIIIAHHLTSVNPDGLYEMLFLYIINERGLSVPVGFCVYTGDANTVLLPFFFIIRMRISSCRTQLFVSNNEEVGGPQWIHTFSAEEHKQLPCQLFTSPWHIMNELTDVVLQCFPKNEVSDTVNYLKDLFYCNTVIDFQSKLNECLMKFNQPSTCSLFNLMSGSLLRNECKDWALCYIPKFKNSLLGCMDNFMTYHMERTQRCKSRKIGRSVYLAIQYHKGLNQRQIRKKLIPGKRADPLVRASGYNRLELLRNNYEKATKPSQPSPKTEAICLSDPKVKQELLEKFDEINARLDQTSQKGIELVCRELAKLYACFANEEKKDIPIGMDSLALLSSVCEKAERQQVSNTDMAHGSSQHYNRTAQPILIEVPLNIHKNTTTKYRKSPYQKECRMATPLDLRTEASIERGRMVEVKLSVPTHQSPQSSEDSDDIEPICMSSVMEYSTDKRINNTQERSYPTNSSIGPSTENTVIPPLKIVVPQHKLASQRSAAGASNDSRVTPAVHRVHLKRSSTSRMLGCNRKTRLFKSGDAI